MKNTDSIILFHISQMHSTLNLFALCSPEPGWNISDTAKKQSFNQFSIMFNYKLDMREQTFLLYFQYSKYSISQIKKGYSIFLRHECDWELYLNHYLA